MAGGGNSNPETKEYKFAGCLVQAFLALIALGYVLVTQGWEAIADFLK